MHFDPTLPLKAVVIGDSAVGKTAIVHRAATGTFSSGPSIPTIGGSHLNVCIESRTSGVLTFSVWDTAGQEQFRTIVPIYFRGAVAAIIVFDLTRRVTFDHVTEWAEILENSGSECLVALVGNKVDLGDRAVAIDEGEAMAQRVHAEFYLETSACNGENVEELFLHLAGRVAKSREPTPAEEGDAKKLPQERAQGNGCC